MRYYEVEFKIKDSYEYDTYSICIKAERKPSLKEAEAFCSSDMAKLGLSEAISVDEIDLPYARMCYDMENEANFPVFA